MKWNHKGKEFDALGVKFVGKKIAIYGAGGCGRELFFRLGFSNCVVEFIDNDVTKQKEGFLGKRVLSVREFAKEKDKSLIVIVATYNDGINRQMMKQMRNIGYYDGENLYTYDAFVFYYLPIYAWYAWSKVIIRSLSVQMTTVCNLNCKGCLSFTAYNRNKMHFPLDAMKNEIDLLFNHVDYVNLFHVTGGEPLLYPHLIPLLDYIGEKYRDKIFWLGTTINGTIIPSQPILDAFKRNNVKVYLDDYRENVELNRKNIDMVEQKLKENDIYYVIQKHGQWMDLDCSCERNTEMSEEELSDKFDLCFVGYKSLHDGRLYMCDFADFARVAGLHAGEPEDYIDLEHSIEKKELMEFIMDCSEKGYDSFCHRCEGNYPINQKKRLAVAEQLARKE
jgi:organic radical activating enzyme